MPRSIRRGGQLLLEAGRVMADAGADLRRRGARPGRSVHAIAARNVGHAHGVVQQLDHALYRCFTRPSSTSTTTSLAADATLTAWTPSSASASRRSTTT